MSWVLITVREGVNEEVRVFDTEQEARDSVVGLQWQDYGYKQSALFGEYAHYELFEVKS